MTTMTFEPIICIRRTRTYGLNEGATCQLLIALHEGGTDYTHVAYAIA